MFDMLNKKNRHSDQWRILYGKSMNTNKKYLTALSKAIAFSVINTCVDPTRKNKKASNTTKSTYFNKNMQDMKRHIMHDSNILNNEILFDECIGDGYDIVQEATLALLEQISKHSDLITDYGFLDTPYQIRRPRHTVIIDNGNGSLEKRASEYKYIDSCIIQECYKAVRRYIENQRNRQGANYIYMDAPINQDIDDTERIYYRLGRCADISGEITDFNGRIVGYDSNITDIERIETIIQEMNLTPVQSKILYYRRQGYGIREIARTLKLYPSTIQHHLKQIGNIYISIKK